MLRLANRALNRLPFVSTSRVAYELRSAIWLIPAICVTVALGLALVLIEVDTRLHLSGGALLLFPGPPAGARSFLSAIVQAMIAFTGLVFSITVVVLQLSSGQFSPRVLRHFLRDRTIQYSLGIFVATFAYAMMVLRAVKGGLGTGQANFVPRLAVTGAFVLVLASVAMFIAYIGHVTNMIRVATIIASIGAGTRRVLSARDAGSPPDGEAAALPYRATIASPRPGVVVSVSTARLVSLAAEHSCMLRLAVRVGDYVPEGAALFEVRGRAGKSPQAGGERPRWLAVTCRHVGFETERTSEQDAAFGFRQLADIALQSLSPAVNAPTTAAQVIDEMHDLMRRLVTEPQPSGCYRDDDGELRLIVPQYRVEDYLQLAAGEIWHYGRSAPQIPARLRRMLDDLADVARPEYRPVIEAWRARISDQDTAACRDAPGGPRAELNGPAGGHPGRLGRRTVPAGEAARPTAREALRAGAGYRPAAGPTWPRWPRRPAHGCG
jgi:uncharacterized membrane protein